MRTVTVVAHNRPQYLSMVMQSLLDALVSESVPMFEEVIICVDPGNPSVLRVADEAAYFTSSQGIAGCHVYENSCKFGVAGNPLVAMQRAFEEHGSDLNLALEDDACLRPDALRLSSWFHESHGGPLSDYTLMSMCNHREFGRGSNPGGMPDDPEMLAESGIITSPFAWCATRWQWPFIKSSWHRKRVAPTGWDFSLSYAMRLEQRRALHPVLSRCQNIGREGGVHESPESFDETQLGLVYSDGKSSGSYRIVARLQDGELAKLDDWMLPEHQLEFPR
jgi:hypothetical protein